MNAKDLRIGGKYSFTNTSVKLHYIGYNFSGNGYWHQFEKNGEQDVWCELLDSDLHLLKPINEGNKQ